MRKLPLFTAAAAVTALLAAVPAVASAGTTGAAGKAAALAPTGALPPLDPAALKAAIGGLPNATVTGAILKVSGSAGNWQGVSGVRDVRTKAPVPANGRFRIGSVSKVFTAALMLQLVHDGKVDLDRTVQHYVPGLLPKAYPPITVRQVLNHTSGLPTDGNLGFGDADWFVAHRLDSWTMRQIVADGVRYPMAAAPGTVQQYNGLNYWVAGVVIEKVTGRTYQDEVTRRIIRPLHLKDTFALDRRDPRLPGPHAHGYVAVQENGKTVLRDVSRQSPWPAAEGGLISSTSDLTRFISALFRGRVVPKPELKEMFRVPDVPYKGHDNCVISKTPGRACFGLGLARFESSNGVVAWGKSGSRPGYTTGLMATRDLSRVIAYSLNATGNKDGSEGPYVVRIAAATFDPTLTSGH
ncbi:serine hydrolase domain-containing protein [Actinomadura rupiterrae]|uniref:serine hydrolase domain-containing protein n=1 Tax=Actinomadura rupiterrae TaxID=559627 RepID=UPI0020A40A67|nr:serine hydrolase domain-containing protein [Actinomadura rupiterrae]MCP2335328.1 D-alanyl-D-alanine carboxypeptidase [Actinomadura rupiterrae]